MGIFREKKASASNAVYGLGFLGALFYYITTAPGFFEGLLGILKAILWPAFLVFHLMQSLNM